MLAMLMLRVDTKNWHVPNFWAALAPSSQYPIAATRSLLWVQSAEMVAPNQSCEAKMLLSSYVVFTMLGP